jgi:hypothetical protein
MAYDSNAATGKVPIFGVPGTVTVEGEGTARTWDITGITVTPGNDLVSARDSDGMVVSRTHFNLSSAGVNRETTIQITALPVGTDVAAAVTAAAPIVNGKLVTVASAKVPGANGVWECTGYSGSGSNQDNVTVTFNGVWSVTNA